METKIYDKLDKAQIEAISVFIDEIKKYENTKLEFPFDDKDSLFALVYEANVLVLCMALSRIQNKSYELITFTNPNKNHPGYFNDALDYLRSYLRESLKIEAEIFMLSDSNISGNEIAKELDFTLVNKELFLYYDYKDFTDYNNKTYSYIKFDFDDYQTYHISDECRKYKNFLRFKITKYSKDSVYLYDLYVKERYRNKKNAKKAFPYILQLLYDEGIKKILLQVNNFNKPALHLYKGYGFKIRQEISYYKIKD